MMQDYIVREWLDNPILVKHIRSRLRPQPLASGVAVVLILCLCIAWAGVQSDLFQKGTAFGLYLCLQAVILVVMGGSQVGLATAGAKSSGILDFHRVSPVPSTALVLGFFFGAPIREYALFAVTLPFSVFCLAFGEPSFRGFVQLMIALVLIAWIVHGLALLNGLLVRSHRGTMGVMGLAGVFFLFLGVPLLFWASNASSLVEMDVRLRFYWLFLPWLAVVLIMAGPILFLLFLASRRKMESDLNHPLSKPQGLAALGLIGFVLEGVCWRGDFGQATIQAPVNRDNLLVINITLLYLMVVGGLILAAMVTPNRAEYLKGLWRASNQGRNRLSVWHDLSLNRIFTAAACLAILAIASIAGSHLDQTPGPQYAHPGSFSLATATAVLVVGYLGLALQFFLLQFGRRGTTYFTLFLFIVWLVPVMIGAILAAGPRGDSPESASLLILNLSPVVGIGFLAAPMAEFSRTVHLTAQACAFTPAALFLFVFGSLLTMAQRSANREFRLSQKGVNSDGLALVVPPLLDPAKA